MKIKIHLLILLAKLAGLTDTGSRQLNWPHRAKAMLAAQFVTHKSRQIRTDCTVAAASDLQSEPRCSLAERRRSSRSQGPKVAMGTAPGLGVICSRSAAPIPLLAGTRESAAGFLFVRPIFFCSISSRYRHEALTHSHSLLPLLAAV